jgi:hypothetical protein
MTNSQITCDQHRQPPAPRRAFPNAAILEPRSYARVHISQRTYSRRAEGPGPRTQLRPAELSRASEDCDKHHALAGVRKLGLDDLSADRPDLHCNVGDRSVGACRVAARGRGCGFSWETGDHPRQIPSPANQILIFMADPPLLRHEVENSAR